ncbi:hypothetical protein L227DRAFT_610512 [Lentinus tigrinus ALCF2SS1-6]|uniref:Uncharacterized protein n=1 Tax=Lentinus tigrinus ALCF2SS1-6 TaxID=1328759 RepID=A0A5C2SCU9_9APHY|nr:hypothetical protein L227DRAFT_610512 [Lentinus tigrinus ALCF2SS1-6]
MDSDTSPTTLSQSPIVPAALPVSETTRDFASSLTSDTTSAASATFSSPMASLPAISHPSPNPPAVGNSSLPAVVDTGSGALPSAYSHPAIVVATRARLTSTVTYSDLSGGYDAVKHEYISTTAAGYDDVASAHHRIVLEEDPDSIAALVLSPADDPLSPYAVEVAITHRKLRFLFRDALRWYLQKRRVDMDSAHLVVEVADIGEAQYLANLPPGLVPIYVVADGVTFEAPIAGHTPSQDVAAKRVMTVWIVVTLFVVGLAMQSEFSAVAGDVTTQLAAFVDSSVSSCRVIATFLHPYLITATTVAMLALLIRREFMLSLDRSQWPINVAARLELVNKDHRAGLRMSLHNLHDKLCKLYVGAANQEVDIPDETAMAVSPLGGATPARMDQDVKADPTVDLIGDMNAKHASAIDLFRCLEGLGRQVNALNIRYGKDLATPVGDRVRLRRAMPRFAKGFKEAAEKTETIREVAAEWMPYFITLTSKDALDQLIAIDHAMKISKKVFLARATPHCEHLARLFRARDELISDSGRLAFCLETAWLSSSSPTVPGYRVRRELEKFEAFLNKATAQAVEHQVIGNALEELSNFAASPTVITGLDGGEIDFARLKQAYVEFRQFMSLLDATIKLCTPLVDEMLVIIAAFPQDISD